MEPLKPLTPCLVGRGTVTTYRDMLRALETLENVEYRFVVDGDDIDSGKAALVKLMADSESSTLVVNGCLFLNVASFRYLDFARDEADRWVFTLNGDGAILELIALPDSPSSNEEGRPHLLSDEIDPEFGLLFALDEEDDED